jgi:hypothetical protein
MKSVIVWTAVLVGAAWAATESLPCAPAGPRQDPVSVAQERPLPTGSELGLSDAPEAPLITR